MKKRLLAFIAAFIITGACLAEGGTLWADDTSLIVKNANAAIIYISIATNFNNYKDIRSPSGK